MLSPRHRDSRPLHHSIRDSIDVGRIVERQVAEPIALIATLAVHNCVVSTVVVFPNVDRDDLAAPSGARAG